MGPEVVVEAGNLLGESPVWDTCARCLWWVDIHGRSLHRYGPREGHGAWPLAEQTGSIGLAGDSRLVCATRTGFCLLDPRSGARQPLAQPLAGASHLRFNDGRVDPLGRFWSGTVQEKRVIGEAAIFRLDGDGQAHKMAEGITVANGIAWSPDRQTMYFADSHVREIYAAPFDADVGHVGRRRLFARIGDGAGMPDGATTDADGCLWVAAIHGGRILRYAPDGRVDRIVDMPVTQPTSCEFGGDGLRTLFVTSARMRLSDADLAREPLAGSVFALDVGVGGLPTPRYSLQAAS